ncbi:MAG: ribosomal-processing cysteine protease Prp [Erysipelotrichaceae bacterium]|nr:ribosomal-processing cysteine protease Prp [Erysipelotrichaceae bacterium]
MIEVKINLVNGDICSLRISGHALQAPYGEDLVCAGVSSIGVGLLNALDILVPQCCQLTMKDYIEVKVLQNSEDVQLILKTAVIQLETIEAQYSNYVNVKKQEV